MSGATPRIQVIPLPLAVRLPIALVVVAVAGWKNWAWLLPIGVMLALPDAVDFVPRPVGGISRPVGGRAAGSIRREHNGDADSRRMTRRFALAVLVAWMVLAALILGRYTDEAMPPHYFC